MLIINGSPHAGGVTDALALAACQGTGDSACDLLNLRDYNFAACSGCNCCAATGKCRLATPPDQAREVFAAILTAKALIIAAPIYFYALPGLLKSFIDRGQLYWHFPLKREPRPAAVILAAGHRKGEQLFAGSLLTLKYFFQPLAFDLRQCLCLRGLEDLQSLRQSPECLGQAEALGREFAC